MKTDERHDSLILLYTIRKKSQIHTSGPDATRVSETDYPRGRFVPFTACSTATFTMAFSTPNMAKRASNIESRAYD